MDRNRNSKMRVGGWMEELRESVEGRRTRARKQYEIKAEDEDDRKQMWRSSNGNDLVGVSKSQT